MFSLIPVCTHADTFTYMHTHILKQDAMRGMGLYSHLKVKNHL